jgi:hypothetical protein
VRNVVAVANQKTPEAESEEIEGFDGAEEAEAHEEPEQAARIGCTT